MKGGGTLLHSSRESPPLLQQLQEMLQRYISLQQESTTACAHLQGEPLERALSPEATWCSAASSSTPKELDLAGASKHAAPAAPVPCALLSRQRQQQQRQQAREDMARRARALPHKVGVKFDPTCPRWIAHWKRDGQRFFRSFSVEKNGFEEAWHMAVKCRRENCEDYDYNNPTLLQNGKTHAFLPMPEDDAGRAAPSAAICRSWGSPRGTASDCEKGVKNKLRAKVEAAASAAAPTTASTCRSISDDKAPDEEQGEYEIEGGPLLAVEGHKTSEQKDPSSPVWSFGAFSTPQPEESLRESAEETVHGVAPQRGCERSSSLAFVGSNSSARMFEPASLENSLDTAEAGRGGLSAALPSKDGCRVLSSSMEKEDADKRLQLVKAAVCLLLRDLRDVCLLSWVPYYIIEPNEEFACLSRCLSLAEKCEDEQQLQPFLSVFSPLIAQRKLPSTLPVRQQKDLLELTVQTAKLVAA
ncbi:putative hypothtetical protein, conserved [Cyclospora cayetanensis]|uniref:Hypothtetical protein, conserved n=1 Tax=Cyclospora cayetanensis TaxID=88456 RepID=A0A1D3CUU6_9EIME|nr:putative hypothtetical protein, conserved [Cyclospora cayetanensis]